MSKLHLGTVGMAVDAGFDGRDGQRVSAYTFDCTGTVDGAQMPFKVKIYGKGADTKLKQSMTVNGTLNSQYGHYDVKKAENPQLFSTTSYPQQGGAATPQQKQDAYSQRQTINYELEAMRIAADLMRCPTSEVLPSYDAMAAKAVEIAKNTICPYLRSIAVRHDHQAATADAHKVTAQAIRVAIQNAGILPNIQAAGVKQGEILAEYERSGNDMGKLITALRARFVTATPPDMTQPDDGDSPF